MPLVEARDVENGPVWLQWAWLLPVAREELCLVVRGQDGSHESQSNSHSLADSHSTTLGKSYLCGFHWPYFVLFCKSSWEFESLQLGFKLCAKMNSEGKLVLGLKKVLISNFRNKRRKWLPMGVVLFSFLSLPWVLFKASWRILN